LIGLSVFFSNSVSIATAPVLTVAIWISTTSNSFTATGLSVALPLTAGIAIGTIIQDNSTAAIPFNQGDRLLLVASTGGLIATITGYISAGLEIL